MVQMKVGSFYRRRDGRIAECQAKVNQSLWPYMCCCFGASTAHFYSPDGKFSDEPSPVADLVSEVFWQDCEPTEAEPLPEREPTALELAVKKHQTDIRYLQKQMMQQRSCFQQLTSHIEDMTRRQSEQLANAAEDIKSCRLSPVPFD